MRAQNFVLLVDGVEHSWYDSWPSKKDQTILGLLDKHTLVLVKQRDSSRYTVLLDKHEIVFRWEQS